MKLSDIVHILNGGTKIENFKHTIKDEIAVYIKCLEKKGSSCSIILDEDCRFAFKKDHLIRLSNYFLNNELTEIEVNYIVDALTLAESVYYESEFLVEKLEEYKV